MLIIDKNTLIIEKIILNKFEENINIRKKMSVFYTSFLIEINDKIKKEQMEF